jgi:hypothetical protein
VVEQQLIQDVDLGQFNRVIQELIQGGMKRSSFQPWELEFLLDVDLCRIRKSSRAEVLRRYQRAVQKRVSSGQPGFPKLSAFVETERARRAKPVGIAS